METIERKLVEQVGVLEKRFANSEETKQFLETSKEFDKLVERGVVQKRGNHLLSATDAHVKSQVWFNAK